ncbi:MAG: flagellar hook protein FlgE [Peptostreptococcaceae bacterium]|nr:flagellar hook protein FlgE [Peptostreptococcaceae bacterium]
MMRSMSSAVSALRNHQTRMDVVGNNIANVNTVGYKTSRVVFKDALNQMVRGAAGATDNRGGMNPHQIGMGMGISSIDTIFTQGIPDNTNKLSDAMIEGEGFFMVSADGNPDAKLYTRAGNFDLDGKGNLVNADGLRVLGYQADEKGNIGTALGSIRVPAADTFPPKVTTETIMEGNLDARTKSPDKETPPVTLTFVGSDATNANNLYHKIGDTYTLNPDNAKFVARETDAYVYDSLGERHNIKLTYVKTASNKYTVLAFAFGKDGKMYPANNTDLGSDSLGNGVIGELTFNSDGTLDKGASTAAVKQMKLTPENGAQPINFSISSAALTQYGVGSTAVMAKQDGYTVGSLRGFEISPDGTVNGVFSNGQAKKFGKIATAVFSNPAGLVKQGGSLFRDTDNSGEPQINPPGTAANGLLKPGYLEMSGVDLGVEFTNMITTQRGFQANSRTISTTDQMLEELVNLKR